MDLAFSRLLNIETCWPLLSDQWPAVQTAFSVLCAGMACCLLTVLLSVPENASAFFLTPVPSSLPQHGVSVSDDCWTSLFSRSAESQMPGMPANCQNNMLLYLLPLV